MISGIAVGVLVPFGVIAIFMSRCFYTESNGNDSEEGMAIFFDIVGSAFLVVGLLIYYGVLKI